MRSAVILVANAALRRSLERLVSDRTGLTLLRPPGRAASVVLATPAECALSQCRAWAARGAQVVILSSVPSATENQRYLEAGAVAYLPMDAGSPLLDYVLAHLDERRRPGEAADGAVTTPPCLGAVDGVCGRALAWLAAQYPYHKAPAPCPWQAGCPLPLDG